jgi:hypothetical protein
MSAETFLVTGGRLLLVGTPVVALLDSGVGRRQCLYRSSETAFVPR